MKGHPTHFTVQAARYSSFDPDRWWETRKGVRTEIVELQKLLLDFVLHPLSFLTSSLSMQRQKGLPVSGGADPWPPPPDQESQYPGRLDAGQSGVALKELRGPGRDPNGAPGAIGSIAVDTVFEGKRKISPTTRTRTVLIPDIMMLEREAALKPAR